MRSRGALLQQLPLPLELAGRTYGELVSYLLAARGVLAIGLYRTKGRNNPVWRLGYVATAPPPATRLHATDRVFVLRARGGDRSGRASPPG